MKLLVAAVLALNAHMASANDILSYIPNTAGGLIEFTDMPCQASADTVFKGYGWVAFTTDAQGRVGRHGGWEVEEPNIGVRWSTGDFSIYINSVVLTEAGKRYNAAHPQ